MFTFINHTLIVQSFTRIGFLKHLFLECFSSRFFLEFNSSTILISRCKILVLGISIFLFLDMKNSEIWTPRGQQNEDQNSRGDKTSKINLEEFLYRGQKILPREIDISSVFFEVLIPRDFTPRSRVLAFSKPIPRLFISRLTSIVKTFFYCKTW